MSGRIGAPTYRNGKISVVRIYHKVLSSDEVNQNYKTLKNRYGLI